MVTISMALSEEDAARLQTRAASSVLDALTAEVLHDDVNADEGDFDAVAKRIVDKNHELYGQLA